MLQITTVFLKYWSGNVSRVQIQAHALGSQQSTMSDLEHDSCKFCTSVQHLRPLKGEKEND